MSAAWAFDRCGPILESNGFQPLPISMPHPSDKDLGKKPPGTLLEWSRPAPVASRLPRYAGCGTGILTATTPAVDIDVRRAELADALDRMVVSVAGDAPVRYGHAPKRLRAYRTPEPFPKLSTAGYRLPGDEPGAKAHKVEILGNGQQFVGYGIHPSTGLPYGIRAAIGDHGLGVWLAWTRASARHDGTIGDGGTPERAWRGIKPHRCGWRYLERLAGGLSHG